MWCEHSPSLAAVWETRGKVRKEEEDEGEEEQKKKKTKRKRKKKKTKRKKKKKKKRGVEGGGGRKKEKKERKEERMRASKQEMDCYQIRVLLIGAPSSFQLSLSCSFHDFTEK